MKVGTHEHRDLFGRTLFDGHRASEAEQIGCLVVEVPYIDVLFRGGAKAMKRKAAIAVRIFAEKFDGPLGRDAGRVHTAEDPRHASVIALLITPSGTAVRTFASADRVNLFEKILLEDAGHVTFFVNWCRYALKSHAGRVRQFVCSFAGAGTTGFAAVAAKEIIEGTTPMMFVEAALYQNRRTLGTANSRIRALATPTLPVRTSRDVDLAA